MLLLLNKTYSNNAFIILTQSCKEELTGEEREDMGSHVSTMSNNGLGSASINLLEQLRVEKCGKPAFHSIPPAAPKAKLWDIDR